MAKKVSSIVSLLVLILLFVPSNALFSAPLPKSTQKALKKLKLDPSILGDIDKELKVPKGWIKGAKKEGKLSIRSSPWTPQEQRDLFAPFKERYPFIKIEFAGANQQGRTIRTLMAYKRGKVLSDVLGAVAGFTSEYKKVDALADLRSIPNWKNIPKGAKAQDGSWVGWNIRHWCMSYNTRLVKQEDLPGRWEDLLNNPVWRGGNLALGNRPQLWALMLWKAKGEEWTKDFLTRLFTEVKPQLRKEGMNALVQLAAAGEFHAAVPSNKARTYRRVLDGAPIGFTCPEPAPVSAEDIMILKRSQNINAARLFINWILSKEGQLAASYARQTTPIREDLQLREIIPFADNVLGKEVSFRSPELEREVMPTLSKFWEDLWLRGKSRR